MTLNDGYDVVNMACKVAGRFFFAQMWTSQ